MFDWQVVSYGDAKLSNSCFFYNQWLDAGSVYYSSFVLLWNLELVSAQEVRRKTDRSVDFFFYFFMIGPPWGHSCGALRIYEGLMC